MGVVWGVVLGLGSIGESVWGLEWAGEGFARLLRAFVVVGRGWARVPAAMAFQAAFPAMGRAARARSSSVSGLRLVIWVLLYWFSR